MGRGRRTSGARRQAPSAMRGRRLDVGATLEQVRAHGTSALRDLFAWSEQLEGGLDTTPKGRVLVTGTYTLEDIWRIGWVLGEEGRLDALLSRTHRHYSECVLRIRQDIARSTEGLWPWQRAERAREREHARAVFTDELAAAALVLAEAERLTRMEPPGVGERERYLWRQIAFDMGVERMLTGALARGDHERSRELLATIADRAGDVGRAEAIRQAPAEALVAACEKAHLMDKAGRTWVTIHDAHLTSASDLDQLRRELGVRAPAGAGQPMPARGRSLAETLRR